MINCQSGCGGGSFFFGGGSYRIRILTYFDVSCMYPACILKDTCIPYVSLCISKCILNAPVILQENTCILTAEHRTRLVCLCTPLATCTLPVGVFTYLLLTYMYLDILHVFYTYPERVQDTFWDTYQIHQDTCILGASLVSHWIHVRIHEDTSRSGS